MSTLITRGTSGKKLSQGSGDFQGFEGIEQIDPAAEETHEVRLMNRKTLTALDPPMVRRNCSIELPLTNVGCLGACTYCKTKHARGHLGSYTVESLVERVRTVISEGVKETWLSSEEDAGAYGLNLPVLLNAIVKELPCDQSTMLRIGMTNPPFILEHLKEIAAGEVIETLSSTNVATKVQEEKKPSYTSDVSTCETCACSAESCSGERTSGEACYVSGDITKQEDHIVFGTEPNLAKQQEDVLGAKSSQRKVSKLRHKDVRRSSSLNDAYTSKSQKQVLLKLKRKLVDDDAEDYIKWGSKPLIDFLTSIGEDTRHAMSERSVESVINKYIRQENLLDHRKKKKVRCDEKLYSIFRKRSVKQRKILKLLDAHFTDNLEQLERGFSGNNQSVFMPCKCKKKQSIESSADDKEVKTDHTGFATINAEENIKLVYLLKRLVLELLKKHHESFGEKVVGSLGPESMLGTSAMATITPLGIWEVIETLTSTDVVTQVREETKPPSSCETCTCTCTCSADSSCNIYGNITRQDHKTQGKSKAQEEENQELVSCWGFVDNLDMGTSSDHWTCLSLFRQILPSRCIIYLTLFFLLLSLCNGDDAGETTDRELPYWVCQAVGTDGSIFVPHPWTFLKIVLLYLLAGVCVVGVAARGLIWWKTMKDAKNAEEDKDAEKADKKYTAGDGLIVPSVNEGCGPENKDAEKKSATKKSNKKNNRKKKKNKTKAESADSEEDKAAENKDAQKANKSDPAANDEIVLSGTEGGETYIKPENKDAEKAVKKYTAGDGLIVPSGNEGGGPENKDAEKADKKDISGYDPIVPPPIPPENKGPENVDKNDPTGGDPNSGNEGGRPQNKDAENADESDPADPIVPSEKEARKPVPHPVKRNFVKLGKLTLGTTESHAYSDGSEVFEGHYDGRVVSVKRSLLRNAEGRELAFITGKEKFNHYACESDSILRLYSVESDVKHVYMCFEKWECSLGDLISFCSSEVGGIRRESLPQKQICFLEEFKKKYKLWEERTGCPTPLLVSLIRDLIRGVAYMHDMGYIHGNLNPESVVIVSKDGTVTVKIADLRLSRHHSDKSMGAVRGKWPAPEQTRRKMPEEGIKNDVYALGLTVAYMLAQGRHLFKNDKDFEEKVGDKDTFYLLDRLPPEACDLWKVLANLNTELRYTAKEALAHPLFWTQDKRNRLFEKASEPFVNFPVTDPRYQKFSQSVSASAGVVWRDLNWDVSLDPKLVSHIDHEQKDEEKKKKKGSYYNREKLIDLVRLVRNTIVHSDGLPSNIKAIVGDNQRKIGLYFDSRFPLLLMAVYRIVRDFFKTNENFKIFFEEA